MTYIKNFKNISKRDVGIAGGKGASLGEMTQAKIPVPPGFVILSGAFAKFLKETDVGVEIDAMWDRLNIKNTDNLEENSSLIREIILKKKFPTDLAKEILKDFKKLNTRYVAVRSSATAEDSKSDARTWRPNILVLSGSPTQRFYLIELADAITHGKSFLTVVSIIPRHEIAEERIDNLEKVIREFLAKRKIPALVKITSAEDVITGAREIVKNYGVGPLIPNTFLLGETEQKENFIQFAGLIQLIYRSRRNVVIVREGTASRADQGGHDKICVWWGGRGRENAGLMLVLGYMLQMSSEWRNSTLILRMIVNDEEERGSAHEQMESFASESRLFVEVEVLVKKPDEGIDETIRLNSVDADLVILGIKPPDAGESEENYAAYYEHLIKRTKKLPSSLLVLSSEEIKFSDIFR